MSRLTPAVLVLVLLNAAVFLAGTVPNWSDQIISHAALWYTSNPHFAAWQWITHMFLHGSVGHIFFNMFALASFGPLLERKWGTQQFLLFYFLCGLGAGLTQTAVNHYRFQFYFERAIAAGASSSTITEFLSTGDADFNPVSTAGAILVQLYRIYAGNMLGASGAIYGVMVAFGFSYPNARLALMFFPVPIAAKYFIPIILAVDLFSGVTGFSVFGPGIAHFAHLGGAAIGFILTLLWRKRNLQPSEELNPKSTASEA